MSIEFAHYKTLSVSNPLDGVVVCMFNRPEARNALNLDMVNETRALLLELENRDDVRALVFAGAGDKAFISGADIAELKERGKQDALARINAALFRDIETFRWPTIAAISGYALGGGCELALACDIRVCTDTSKFGQPEVSLGIIPGAGATYRLPRIVGQGMARELIFTANIIDAAEALRIGLVNRVVSGDALMDVALELATKISSNSALALQLAKVGLNASNEEGTEACMALEASSQAILFEDESKHTRMGRFLEARAKRKKKD